ncbi:Zinc finger, LIM-type [Cinara cedri]|uniref:Zinc finger, LIM-type n=1 Tax=Cinara cedri TaxID=506608 RepID=A0A5E4NMW6_9HEMI|nr:Zinc finger, LIM-type [Cinara cedri]
MLTYPALVEILHVICLSNTLTTIQQRTYNRNRQNRFDNYVYADIPNTPTPSYTNSPLYYDYVNPIDFLIYYIRLLDIHPLGIPVFVKAASFETHVRFFGNTASRLPAYLSPGIYKPTHQPINTPKLPTMLYSSHSFPQIRTTCKQNEEVHSLSDILEASLNTTKEIKEFKPKLSDYRCTLCGKISLTKELTYTDQDTVYHTDYLICTHCGILLRGKLLFFISDMPYCDKDYLESLHSYAICDVSILFKILKATGHAFHASCFHCVICLQILNGIPFTVDTKNQIYCISDYLKKFAPQCGICKLPIVPKSGEGKIIRYVALNQSFYIGCYRCEDCGGSLGKNSEGIACYPLYKHLCKSCNAIRIQILTPMIT